MDNNDLIKRLAKEFKARRLKCQLYDGHVCTWRFGRDTDWVTIPVTGEPLTQNLRFTHRGRKIKLFSNSTFVNGSVAGAFACELMSLNSEMKNGHRSRRAGIFRLQGSEFPIYTVEGVISPEQREVLNRTELTALLSRITVGEGECVLFSNGDISFYLRHPEFERVRAVIDGAINLADSMEIVEASIDLTSLPEPFHPLIPLIEKWAVSDDLDREDLLDTTPNNQLKRMIEKVDPYIRQIDAYLDELGDAAQTEAVAALGCLAECVVEAKQKLSATKESH